MRTATTLRPGVALLVASVLLTATSAVPEPLTIELEQALPGSDMRTGEPILEIKLKEVSRRVFAIFSGNNIGRKIELRVDGEPILSSVIREPLLSGSLQISGMPLEKTQALAGALSKPGIKVEVDYARD